MSSMSSNNGPFWMIKTEDGLRHCDCDTLINEYNDIDTDEKAKQWLEDCGTFAQNYYKKTGIQLLMIIPSPDGAEVNIVNYWGD